MILLHGTLEAGRFLVWGETPPADTDTAPRRGRAAGKQPRPLPFADDEPSLSETLRSLLPQLGKRKLAAETAFLWLPTVQGQPVASSPLIAAPPEAGAELSLAPWTATVLPLPADLLTDLLAECLDQRSRSGGVLIGKTLAYWSLALRFASALVAREQFLPDLAHGGDTWRACWQPVLGGAQGQHFARLAHAMPAACRALGLDAALTPGRAPADLLRDFLAVVVDQLVRSSLAPPVVPPTGKRKTQQAPAFDSIHDQWLYALRAPDPTLKGTTGELTQLAQQLRTWNRPAALAASSPFRLCFRLEEPPSNGDGDKTDFSPKGNWTLRYLLQAQDDPSLLLPVADAWNPKGQKAGVLRRGGFEPREYLLAALGQAASLYPQLEAGLKAAEPAELTLDTGGAHRFLNETASLLQQAGFAVLLPAWWTGKGTKQRLTLSARVKSPSMTGGSGLSLEEIVKFDWKVALGDTPLSLRELETLARLKSPLVKVRGQWVQVSADEIAAALDFWKKHAEDKATVRDLIKMELGAGLPAGAHAGVPGLTIEGVEADGWIKDLLHELEGKASFAELPAPAGFQGTLRPYQVRGYSWLAFLGQWGLGACLADDMGLGKTIQTLALVQRDWEASRGSGVKAGPVLLVCPMSVVGNWKKEAGRFTPELPVLIHHGQKRTRGPTFAREARQHALVITSYSLLHRDLALFQKVPWAGVVLDEAQNIKNPETKQAHAARSLEAGYRLALTGTPVENHVGDLWSIWQFLNPGFLGSQAEFHRKFFVPIQLQNDRQARDRLKHLTGPFFLRRLKTDKAIIADLPDKLEMKVYCNLTREQVSLYAAVVAELDEKLSDSEGIQRKGQILGTLSKLKQVCNHPAQFLGDNSALPGRSGKLARLTEMLEEVLEAGDRALIFTQFTEMGALIQRHLQETLGREVLFLHGGVPQKQRDRLVERFQAPEGTEAEPPQLFLLSLKAGGTGLNLTAANHVFHFDRWWNPAVEQQATDRAFRIGQKRDVQVHKFLCVGTLEEKIDEMIERKQEIAAQVLGAGENWLTELSNEQIKDLFALRQEAVAE